MPMADSANDKERISMTNPTEPQQDTPRRRGRPPGHSKSAAELAALSAAAQAMWAERQASGDGMQQFSNTMSAAASARWARHRARTPDMVLFETAIHAIEKARKAGMEEEDIQEILCQALGLDERTASKSESVG